ncbi:hypothetical protein, partial [Parachitinimonas caeni]
MGRSDGYIDFRGGAYATAAKPGQQEQSQVSKSKANIEQVKLALQRYVASTGRMPCPAAVNLPQTSPN